MSAKTRVRDGESGRDGLLNAGPIRWRYRRVDEEWVEDRSGARSR